MRSRRPYDDAAYIIAAVLGIPLLVGLVWLLLGYTRLAIEDWGLGAGVVLFLVGVALLTAGTYKSVELLRQSTGR